MRRQGERHHNARLDVARRMETVEHLTLFHHSKLRVYNRRDLPVQRPIEFTDVAQGLKFHWASQSIENRQPAVAACLVFLVRCSLWVRSGNSRRELRHWRKGWDAPNPRNSRQLTQRTGKTSSATNRDRSRASCNTGKYRALSGASIYQKQQEDRHPSS